MPRTHKKVVELALQGGGAHGAFTWGVLDRLLADERISIEGISGTSAGAMNAVVMADGLFRGGREGARESLRSFWQAVSRNARYSPIQRSPLDILFGRWSINASPAYLFFDALSRVVSPYAFNPFNLNPLRDLLAEQVNFDNVRCCDQVKLFVSATNVRTGKARVFRRHEMSADAIMASACLPLLFQAVEIDGEAYWDGGYMGNPALFPLVDESDAHDLVIVQINPIHRAEIPRTAHDILDRLNEITFNASLIKEVRAIALIKRLIEEEGLDRARYKDMRLHRISADEELNPLGASSKLNAEWRFLKHLHDIGYETTGRWLEQNFDKLGKESSIDISSVYL